MQRREIGKKGKQIYKVKYDQLEAPMLTELCGRTDDKMLRPEAWRHRTHTRWLAWAWCWMMPGRKTIMQ